MKKPEMPLVKVRRFAQVTIPAELRKQCNLVEGGYLEVATSMHGGILSGVRRCTTMRG